jgi:hypothetical protein
LTGRIRDDEQILVRLGRGINLGLANGRDEQEKNKNKRKTQKLMIHKQLLGDHHAARLLAYEGGKIALSLERVFDDGFP